MSSLGVIQDAFQDRLLTGSDAILEHLGDGARLLKAYDHAYGARLIEVLAEDFETVHTLLGDESFAEAAQGYIAAHPSRYRSIRWVGGAFAEWLTQAEPWREHPMLAEMAAVEWALGLAFDAPDTVRLSVDALAAIPPEAWPGLRFDAHPALSVVVTAWSVMDFHQAIAAEQDPEGPPGELDALVTWAVWREPETLMVRYRDLADDEAAVARAAVDGATFAEMCEVAADIDDAENAAVRVAGYLRHWIVAGWFAGFAEDGLSR